MVDTWWQTETGAIMITPLPGVTTLKPGSATRPFPGIAAEIRTERGDKVDVGGGLLALTRPWPAMLRGIYGDPDRYVRQYWSKWGPGVYVTGDGAKRDADGYFWLLGRVDDVINVAGHRIGTMEVESALVDHPSVAEAAVVGRAHEIKGPGDRGVRDAEGRRPAEPDLIDELKEHVVKKIGAIARPDDILFTADLPKTRSGKIMRRLLRDIAEGKALGDTTTLADPAVVAKLKENYEEEESARHGFHSERATQDRGRAAVRRMAVHALDAVTAVLLGELHGALGIGQQARRIDDVPLGDLHVDDRRAQGDRDGGVRPVIHEPETLFHGTANPFGQLGGVVRIGVREQHRDGIFRVPRDPVVLTEVLPNQNAEPLENPVADTVAMFLVDLRQVIDVEEDQRNRMADPARAFHFLFEHGLQQRARIQRGQAIGDRGFTGLELSALDIRGEQIERGAANELRDERPRFADRADGFIQRELVERRPLGQIHET